MSYFNNSQSNAAMIALRTPDRKNSTTSSKRLLATRAEWIKTLKLGLSADLWKDFGEAVRQYSLLSENITYSTPELQ